MASRIVVSVDHEGRMVELSDVTASSIRAGIESTGEWLGHYLWTSCVPHDAQRLRATFFECLSTGRPQTIVVTTVVGKEIERWRCDLHRVQTHVAVRSCGTLLPATDDGERLTLREKQVAWLKTHDTPIGEISRRLALLENTVRKHLARIRSKLRLHTNAGLGVWAVRSGLYDSPFPGNDLAGAA